MQGRPNENTALITIHHAPAHQAVRGFYNDDDSTSTEEVVDTSTLLGRLKAFYYAHEPVLNVGTDLYGALAVYLLVNNELYGDPTTYDDNLNKLNLYFLGYAALAFIISMVQNNVDKTQNPRINFAFTLINQFMFMLNLTASNTEAFQTDLLAAQAQVTNPQGGPNDVNSETFIRYDVTIPVVIGGLVAFRQYILDTHKVLKKNNKDFTKPLRDEISVENKKRLHRAHTVIEVIVNGGMVFGSSLSDAVYYSLEFCGVDFLKHKQYATTSLYGVCLGAGMVISTLAQTKKLPASSKQLLRVNLGISVTVGTVIFYNNNIRDTLNNGMNLDTMIAMIALPALMISGTATSYAINYCRNNKKQAANANGLHIQEVRDPVEQQPALEHEASASASQTQEPSDISEKASTETEVRISIEAEAASSKSPSRASTPLYFDPRLLFFGTSPTKSPSASASSSASEEIEKSLSLSSN